MSTAPIVTPELSAVIGHILLSDTSPLPAISVRAFDKNLRAETLLGETKSDTSGAYTITYTAQQLGRPGKQAADLVVRVFDGQGKPLAASDVLFDAPAEATIDVVISADQYPIPSEYEKLLQAITPAAHGVNPADLTSDEVAFLAAQTGADADLLELLVVAAQDARTTKAAPEIFYGLMRQGFSTDLLSLLSNSAANLKQALQDSITANIIPSKLQPQLDATVANLQQLLPATALQTSIANTASPSLGDLLATSTLSRAQQERFVSLYSNRDVTQDLWTAIKQDPTFPAGSVEELRTTLQLGGLTLNNLPLVKALRSQGSNAQLGSLRDLVKLDDSAWTRILSSSPNGQAIPIPAAIPGNTPREKTQNYISAMKEMLRMMFPTATFAQAEAKPPEIDLNLVKTVLAHNPQLDPSDFLPAAVDWTGVASQDQPKAISSFEALRQEINAFPGFDYKFALGLSSTGPGRAAGSGPIAPVVNPPVVPPLPAPSAFLNPVRDGMTKFLANAQDFDLHNHNIDAYIAAHTSALQGIPPSDQPAVLDQIKRVQRVFRVSPKHEDARVLLAEGLDSSYAISSVPRNTFLNRFQDRLGGTDEALKIHTQAQQATAKSTALSAQIRLSLNSANTPVVLGPLAQKVKDVVKGIPNWEDLFGSLSLCDCGHCMSVYGPASYFVDLLQFLRHSGHNAKHKTPLQVLLKRRPDLEYIKLTCQNAETSLPYVDLVDEILESYIALGHLDASTAKDTGDTSADQLAATPQYVNEQAYATLAQAVYPFTLPFDRPLEIVRTYLEHLGTSRAAIMQTFQTAGGATDLAIACESLKISPQEYAVLLGVNLSGAPLASPPDLAQLYGYAAGTTPSALVGLLGEASTFLQRTGIDYEDLLALLNTRFLNPNQSMLLAPPVGGDPCDLDTLQIQNLNADVLLQMFRFIRLWKKLGWQIAELDLAISSLSSTGIDNALLQKIAALQELQTALNLPLNQLLAFWANIDTSGRNSLYITLFQNPAVLTPPDPAFALSYSAPLNSLPSGTLPDSVKDQISYDAATKLLRFTGTMSDAQRDDLLAWSQDGAFQTVVNSLYNVQVSGPIDLATSNQALSDHVNALLSAVRISTNDLAAIRAATGLADSTSTRAFLNLANLSILYRYATLARALNVSINNLLTLISLTALNPFLPATPEATVTFQKKAIEVQESEFSIAQLGYLYLDVDNPQAPAAPLKANVNALMSTLQSGLEKIIADTTAGPDPTGDLLRKELGILLDSSLVDAAMGLLAGTAVYSAPLGTLPNVAFPAGLQSRISFAGGELHFVGAMTDAEQVQLLALSADAAYQSAVNNLLQQPRDFITANFAPFLNPPDAIAQLINTPGSSAAGKFNYILPPLASSLRDNRSRSLIKQTLCDDLSLDSATLNILIDNGALALLKSRTNSSLAMIQDFLSLVTPSPYGPPPPADPTPIGESAYRLLHKVALLIHGFGMAASEVSYLSAHGTDFAGVDPSDPGNPAKSAPFDLNALPLDPSTFTPALFGQWERLNSLFTLRDSLPTGDLTLYDVFQASALNDALDRFASLSEWDAQELKILAGSMIDPSTGAPIGFKLPAGAFKNEIALVTLQACWRLIKRLGISAEKLFVWAGAPADRTQAEDLQNLAKSKYDNQTWLGIAKPLNDVLRASQKAALIAYLLNDPVIQARNITDSTGLYKFFLVDVDMSPCMLTSRIVQACSSVQLFVQRCLTNLEQGTLDEHGNPDPAQDVSPSQIDADRWEWMSQYRVWEANRKVFLYPENWILPELRDDKSPFFEELEAELLQNDLTEDTAEQAIMHYLQKLAGVARLDICGMYWQKEKEADPLTGIETEVLHVFGRTFHSPHTYYYRTLAVQTGVWTAWEEIPLDIQSDHLVPVFWNGHLYLFWPIFQQQSDASQTLSHPILESEEHWKWRQKHTVWARQDVYWKLLHALWDPLKHTSNSAANEFVTNYNNAPWWQILPTFDPNNEPVEPQEPQDNSQPAVVHWQISLAWSEYRQNIWTAAQTSTGFIVSPCETKTLSNVIDDLNGQSVPHQATLTKIQNIYRDANQSSPIVEIYLPKPEEHFFRTSIESGEVVLEVYRRYDHEFDIFGRSYLPGTRMRAYDHLGYFRTACGIKVQSIGTAAGQQEKAFNSLNLPAGATNSFMTLADSMHPARLEFKSKGATYRVLQSIPSASMGYDVLNEHQLKEFSLKPPFQHFFYQDKHRSYYVEPETVSGTSIFKFAADSFLRFDTFFHPHVCAFIESLNRDGVPGMLALANQRLADSVSFADRYAPSGTVMAPYPKENVDFSPSGAYSLYNWELFFHIPLLIATSLSQHQRFEEAQQWFQYVFNPTDTSDESAPRRFWSFRPFRENTEDSRIQDLLTLLDYTGADPATLAAKNEFEDQVTAWRNKPFDPHLIARLRPIAFQKTVVMKYLDNLIAWGDSLFGQDTMESVNQATQLYVMAQEILGPRPQTVQSANPLQPRTYHDLKGHLDQFSNALITFENQYVLTGARHLSDQSAALYSGLSIGPVQDVGLQLLNSV